MYIFPNSFPNYAIPNCIVSKLIPLSSAKVVSNLTYFQSKLVNLTYFQSKLLSKFQITFKLLLNYFQITWFKKYRCLLSLGLDL